MSRHHTTRLSTFGYRGTHRYSWTICTEFRERVFVTEPLVTAIRSHFLITSTTTHVAVLAYCFMPDHVHLLIEGLKPDSSALHFIDKAKQSSGYWYARQTGRRLWQKTGWDRVLRSDEDTWAVARYIINNPVRADLVQAPVDYPFWGSLVYSREEVLEFIAAPAG